MMYPQFTVPTRRIRKVILMQYTNKGRNILRKDNPPFETARLEAVLHAPETKQVMADLEALYADLPGGECKGCTRCCSESVNVSFGEILHIISGISSTEGLMTPELGKRIMNFYFNELAKAGACPFLENGKCVIYSFRPLQCRLFGVYERDAYEKDYLEVREENRNTAALLKEHYGVVIPTELVDRKLPYCDDFVADRLISREEKRGFMERLYKPDAALMEVGFLKESEWGLSLVAWLARLVIGNHLAGEVRFQAIEALNDAEMTLRIDDLSESYGNELSSVIQAISI